MQRIDWTRLFVLGCLVPAMAACGEPEGRGRPVVGGTPVTFEGKPPLAEELHGLWEGTLRAGGMNAFMVLHPDGRFEESLAVMVEAKYRYDGYDRRIEFDAPEGAPGTDMPAVSVAFEGDTLIFGTGEDPGQGLRKTRVGEPVPGTEPIVGVWSYTHPVHGPMIERYEPDGTFVVRMPRPEHMETGRWHLEDGELVLELATSGERRGKVRIDGDLIQFTVDERAPLTYRRSPHGIWYGPLTPEQLAELIRLRRAQREARPERGGPGG